MGLLQVVSQEKETLLEFFFEYIKYACGSPIPSLSVSSQEAEHQVDRFAIITTAFKGIVHYERD